MLVLGCGLVCDSVCTYVDEVDWVHESAALVALISPGVFVFTPRARPLHIPVRKKPAALK